MVFSFLNIGNMGTLTTQAKNKPAQPFLKWAGGKRQLINQYQELFPSSFEGYYEPFLGGGAIFFHFAQFQRLNNRVCLSDTNEILIEAYSAIRDHTQELIDILHFHKKNHCKEYYYEIRSQHSLPTLAGRAGRLIYLNKTCFNGLYRVNRKAQFNVPIGSYKDPLICDEQNLKAVASALQGVSLKCQSFGSILNADVSEKDFVYFDPPYAPVSDTSKFVQYGANGFGNEDQATLSEVFKDLAEKGVKVMLSNSDCKSIRELYQGFNLHEVQASRNVNSRANGRGKIPELVITSY